MTTLLGFDFGTRKIGVAVGQRISGTATPITTLRYRGQKPDWEGIAALIDDWQPQGLVLGLPYRMDDSEEDWIDRARRFGRQLEGRFGLPVHLVDERLTTLEAAGDLERLRHRGGTPLVQGKTRQPDLADAYAAKLILETWLTENPPS